MTMKRRMDFPWRTTGIAVVLSVGIAMCWAQKGNMGLQNAAAQLQQQQMAIEQAKTLSFGQVAGQTSNPRQAGANSPFPSSPGDEISPYFQDSLRAKRNDERQRRLESDTQRLVSLANQLKSEVTASGAESMTPEMLRQMDEIEKLARNVKDRMRN
jgi:hypothetical protein